MSLIVHWPAYFLFMNLCTFINALTINPNDRITGISNHYKIVENYQLLGGKFIRNGLWRIIR